MCRDCAQPGKSRGGAGGARLSAGPGGRQGAPTPRAGRRLLPLSGSAPWRPARLTAVLALQVAPAGTR